MGYKNTDFPINKEELEQLIIDAATPIDYDKLIEQGILKKKRGWYKVLKANELPKAVLKKANAIKVMKNGTLLKFHKPTKAILKYASIIKNKHQ